MSNERVVAKIRELEKEGRLSPNDVVDEAANPDSPLHTYFEWDDTEGARKYRLLQARTLIRTIKVEVTVRDVPLTVVGYVRDPDLPAKEAGYRNVMSLRTEVDSARLAVVAEMRRVSNAVKRAKGLANVLGIDEDIERIDEIARSIIERTTLKTIAPAGPAQ
jgi:hypothetical protein